MIPITWVLNTIGFGPPYSPGSSLWFHLFLRHPFHTENAAASPAELQPACVLPEPCPRPLLACISVPTSPCRAQPGIPGDSAAPCPFVGFLGCVSYSRISSPPLRRQGLSPRSPQSDWEHWHPKKASLATQRGQKAQPRYSKAGKDIGARARPRESRSQGLLSQPGKRLVDPSVERHVVNTIKRGEGFGPTRPPFPARDRAPRSQQGAHPANHADVGPARPRHAHCSGQC